MLNTLNLILDFFCAFFIRGIFISVLVILFARRSFGNRIETDISMQIIRWIMLVYSFGVIISFILLIILEDRQEYLSFLKEPYALSVLIANSIVPLALLIKKLGGRTFYILLISVLINYGWLMESFVIHVPSILRGDYTSFLPYKNELLNLTKGVIIGLLTLIIGNSIKSLGRLRTNKL